MNTKTLRERVRLVSHGKAEAVAVTADTPTRTAEYAAEERIVHVKKASSPQLCRK